MTSAGGWVAVARRPIMTAAIAGLAQGAVLCADFWLAHTDPILLFVLEIAAGFLVARFGGGWPGAMAGVLLGGTIIATANTDLTAGHVGWGFLVSLLLAGLLFTPGHLLGSAWRSLDDVARGAAPDTGRDETTPSAKIGIALVILAADVAIMVWVVATFRLPGP